jgi:DNA polymerase V
MTNRFTDEPQYANSVTIPLPVATQDTAELIRYALRGIEQIFRESYRYKKDWGHSDRVGASPSSADASL